MTQYSDLQTNRLTLSFFDPGLESHYAKIYNSYNHPSVIAKQGKTVNSHADLDTRAKKFSIPASLCHKSPPPVMPWLLCHFKGTEEYVGFVAVHFRAENSTLAYNIALGWSMLSDYQGKGFATEAVGALLEFCDGVLGVQRVFARIAVDNIASRRVAEKAEGNLVHDETGRAGDKRDGTPMVEYIWDFGL